MYLKSCIWLILSLYETAYKYKIFFNIATVFFSFCGYAYGYLHVYTEEIKLNWAGTTDLGSCLPDKITNFWMPIWATLSQNKVIIIANTSHKSVCKGHRQLNVAGNIHDSKSSCQVKKFLLKDTMKPYCKTVIFLL